MHHSHKCGYIQSVWRTTIVCVWLCHNMLNITHHAYNSSWCACDSNSYRQARPVFHYAVHQAGRLLILQPKNIGIHQTRTILIASASERSTRHSPPPTTTTMLVRNWATGPYRLQHSWNNALAHPPIAAVVHDGAEAGMQSLDTYGQDMTRHDKQTNPVDIMSRGGKYGIGQKGAIFRKVYIFMLSTNTHAQTHRTQQILTKSIDQFLTLHILAGRLPGRLVAFKNLKGVFHVDCPTKEDVVKNIHASLLSIHEVNGSNVALSDCHDCRAASLDELLHNLQMYSYKGDGL